MAKERTTKAKKVIKTPRVTSAQKKAKETAEFLAKFELVCLLIDDGMATGKACKGIISNEKFYDLIREYPECAKRYAQACARRPEGMFERMIDIADDGSNDTYKDEDGNVFTNYDVIQRSKLRVDTYKWAIAKLAPKKYGDKLDIDASVTVSNIINLGEGVDPNEGASS